MKKIGIFLLSVSIYIFSACNEENEVDPKVETADAIPTSSSTFIAKGNIVKTGNIPILDYGFSYSASLQGFGSKNESLGNSPTIGPFEKEISVVAQSEGYSYTTFVRAYITNEKGTVYGEAKQLTLPSMTITSVVPLAGKIGDLITISGSNFSTNPLDNKVTFNKVPANVKEATSTKLVVEIPEGISNDYSYSYSGVKIEVEAAGRKITATDYFKLFPSATGFSPQTGTFGTSVTITGSNFYGYSVNVLVGGVTVSSNNVTNSSVTFTIPSSVTTEKLKISISFSGYQVEVPGEFTINPPEITSFTPITGIGGTLITITGKNFNTSSYGSSYTKVKLGNTEASIQSSSATEMKVTVPKVLSLGNYKLSVSTGVHTVTAATEFTLSSPQITSFQPQAGIPGTYVTINGSNFGSQDYYNSTVLFGSSQVSIYSWSENSIRVLLPSSIAKGNVKITVNSGGQSVTSTDSFTIQ